MGGSPLPKARARVPSAEARPSTGALPRTSRNERKGDQRSHLVSLPPPNDALETADEASPPSSPASGNRLSAEADSIATADLITRWCGVEQCQTGASAGYARLLAKELRLLGPRHLQTMVTRGDLAWCRGCAGDPSGATEGFRRLREDLKQVLRPGHPLYEAVERAFAYWQRHAAAHRT